MILWLVILLSVAVAVTSLVFCAVMYKKFFTTQGQDEENIRRIESEALNHAWQTHRDKVAINKNPNNETRSVVLVETRPHRLLKRCIDNICTQLPDWKVHVVHGLDNEEFVKRIIADREEEIQTTLLKGVHNLRVTEFSRLIGSETFWKDIADTDRVLMTQTDAWICNDSKHDIEDFFVYDYVGAPWVKWRKGQQLSENDASAVGNCGFCLCKRDVMLQTVINYPYIDFVHKNNSHAVDVYFAQNIANTAPALIAKAFSVESVWYDRPVGVHKPFNMNKNKLAKLELHCQGVLNLLDYR